VRDLLLQLSPIPCIGCVDVVDALPEFAQLLLERSHQGVELPAIQLGEFPGFVFEQLRRDVRDLLLDQLVLLLDPRLLLRQAHQQSVALRLECLGLRGNLGIEPGLRSGFLFE
jgi:hypothetical protein